MRMSPMIFRIFIMLSFCVGAAELSAANQIIQNDVFWKDLSGNPIYSQGGGVFKFGDTYYWYGVKYDGAVTYCKSPGKKVGSAVFNAVTCYSSKDLVSWKFENNVLSAEPGGTLDPSIWVGRLGVAYNGNTKKYVLVTQYQGTPNTTQLFATCSTPGGKFTIDHTQAVIENVVNNNAGDQTIFVDDDRKAYLVFSSQSGRANTYVAPLRASDFLAVEPAKKVFGGAGREGNCMFKHKGRYYICSSDLHGWNASHCYYISATNILGPYSTEAVMENTDLDFCHVTQTGFFITVNGTIDTTVLFCGDRWSDFAGNGLGYNQWCPLSFNGNLPVFNSLSQFNIDADAGTWSAGMSNNYLLNPSFEADRVTQTSLAGWTNAANASGSHVSGNFCLQQTTSGTSYQNVSTIPNGTYTLTAWVQSSRGQTTCKVFATNFGGSEMSYAINKAISSWTQISIPGIIISNGKCQVGINSVANDNNWCKVDDISLVNSSPVKVTDFQTTGQIQMQSRPPLICAPFSFYHSFSSNTQLYSLSGKQLGDINTQQGNVISQRSFNFAKSIYVIKIAR